MKVRRLLATLADAWPVVLGGILWGLVIGILLASGLAGSYLARLMWWT